MGELYCHNTCVKTRGQLCGTILFRHHVNSRDQMQAVLLAQERM